MPKASWRLAVVLLCFGGCGRPLPQSSQVDAIIGENSLIPLSKLDGGTKSAWDSRLAAIGRTPDGCTAFHVGQGLVMTAGHCVAELPAGAPCQALSIQWEDKDHTLSRCLAVLDRAVSNAKDIAFLKVDPAPAAALNLASERESGALVVFGYPKDEEMHIGASCHKAAGEAGTDRFRHDCDTLPGFSGAPIFAVESGHVVGIHNGGYDEFNEATEVLAASVTNFLSDLVESDAPTAHMEFGPFADNASQLLASFGSAHGAMVAFTLNYIVEDIYDQVRIVDGRGRVLELSGEGTVFLNLPTPVTVAFYSDYVTPSTYVGIGEIRFSRQE